MDSSTWTHPREERLVGRALVTFVTPLRLCLAGGFLPARLPDDDEDDEDDGNNGPSLGLIETQ